MMLHLPDRTIAAIALNDRESSSRERAHLADCARCRTRVQQVRDVLAATRDVEPSDPPMLLLERIKVRIDAGERVILPVSDPARGNGRQWTRIIGVAAAALILIAIGAMFRRPSSELAAAATTGSLLFSPAAPHAGDMIRVGYSAPEQLAHDDSLVLRARFRSRRDDSYSTGTHQQSVAILHRDRDGTFRAAFRLPDTTLFAIFAVENTTATRIDSHGKKFWQLLVHGSDGRPLFNALKQREADLMGRSMTDVLAAARERAALYPDNPDAWSSVWFAQEHVFGVEATRRLPEHRARAIRLSDEWKHRTPVPYQVVDGLLTYVREVMQPEDSAAGAIKAFWRPVRARMVMTDSTNPDVITAQWWALNSRGLFRSPSGDSARIALAAAERFWDGRGRDDPSGVIVGYQIARAALDSGDAYVRWVDRYAAIAAASAEYIYSTLAVQPALRRVAVARLSALADALLQSDDRRRPLEQTRAQAAEDDTLRAQNVLGMTGDILLQLRDSPAARATFRRATATGWNVGLFRKLAMTELALADTTRALASFAHVAADPSSSRGTIDSLDARGVVAIGAAPWHAMVTAARAAMHERIMAHAVRLRVPDDVALLNADSTRTTLQAISRNRATVVTFWSTCCGDLSKAQLLGLDSLSARLGRMNAALVPVSSDVPSPATMAFVRAHHVNVPVYFDHNHAAEIGLNQWLLPEYFVLDASGRVRFTRSSAELALAQVEALNAAH